MKKTDRPVGDVAADPINPREISPEEAAGLGVSLERFGDLSGIVWNGRNGLLVAGHQRWRELGAAGATTWTQESEDAGHIRHPKTGERFRIRIVDWDDEVHRAANLTANNPAIQGRFTSAAAEQLAALEGMVDYEALRLDALAEQLAALEGMVDYEALRLDALAEQLAAEADPTEPGSGNTDPDAAVEPPANPTTKLGDLWVLGDHRLLCGDSTKPEDVARLMGGETAALVATDPPYGVDLGSVKAGMPGDAGAVWGEGAGIANDALDPEQLGQFLDAVFAACPFGPTVALYVWHPSGELNEVFRKSVVTAGFLVHRQIIWVKPSMVLTRSGMYHWRHEPCFYGWRTGNQPPWYGEKNQTSVWEIGRDDGRSVHPTQKPVALFEIPMANHTREGEVCYEPFSGSGSQIMAGERMKRRVFAMELSPRWVDAAVARWEAFTGKTAHREDAPPTPPHSDPPDPQAPKRGSRRKSGS